MKIKIRAFHGTLGTNKSALLSQIATTVSANAEWEFEGTVGEFADRYKLPFLAYPFCPDLVVGRRMRVTTFDEDPMEWLIYVSDYPRFGQR